MKKKWTRKFDPETNILWFGEKGEQDHYIEPYPGLMIEFGDNNKIIGVEIHNIFGIVEKGLNHEKTNKNL